MSQVDKLPELPVIDNPDLLFSVHMHKDLKVVAPNESEEHDWGDTDRLAEMGRQALNMALTTHFFQKRPIVKAEEIKMWTETHSKPERLDDWLDSYKLKSKFRVPQAAGDSIYNNPIEMANYFYTYLGAIFVTKGPDVVQNWISKLVEPEVAVPKRPWERSASQSAPESDQKRGASSSSSSIPKIDEDDTGLPKIFLSTLNEAAYKKGKTVNWTDTSAGESHLPIWTVRCFLDNIERGCGQARDKKAAKLLAARRAWVNLQWEL